MPVAIQIPNVRASAPPAREELAEMLRQAEAAGFDSAWVMENQLGAASDRAPRFEEHLQVMRALWNQPQVDFDGRFVKLRAARMEPKPLQTPLPVWFGASSPRALERSAKFADGWIGGGASPSSAFAPTLAQLREYLEHEGRDPAAFPVGKRAYVAIDRPQQEVDEWFHAVYGGAIPPEVATTGTAAQVAHELRQLREDGAELLLIAPVGDDRPQLELIVEHVLPALA